MSILIAILVFAVLVLVHEFGHFIVAKRAGVRVDEFAIGFPPRLFSFKRGETTYSLNLIPLGGYVRMPGENGELTDESTTVTTNAFGERQEVKQVDPRTFAAQSARNRAAILVAGVTMNLLFAWVIYSGVYAVVGEPHYDIPTIGVVEAGSPARMVGFQNGDRILAINGQSVHSQQDVSTFIANAIAVDKSNSATVPLSFTFSHGGQNHTVTVNARRNPPSGQGHVGFSIDVLMTPAPLWKVPVLGIQQIGQNFVLEGQGIQQIIAGVIKPGDAFTGPVGIVKATGDSASAGPAALFYFMAFLSWNLAVVNLLPIPGLDGGRLLILGIEVLRRGKRLAPEREGLINLAGMVFLLSLIAIITVNDISHIIGH